jgi:hypothetical protein
MCPPHFAREGFDIGRYPGRAGPGSPRCLLQCLDTPGRVLRHPRVDRLPRHPVPDGHLADGRSVQYLEDSSKALLCQPIPINSLCSTRHGEPASQIETELVKDVPRTNCQLSSEAPHDTTGAPSDRHRQDHRRSELNEQRDPAVRQRHRHHVGPGPQAPSRFVVSIMRPSATQAEP